MDVETTTFQHGSVYSARNKLCYVGIRTRGVNHLYDIEYDGRPYGGQLREIQDLLSTCDPIVVFNGKFDLGWLKRYGVDNFGNVWDCQLAEFLDLNQTTPFPSLDAALQRRGLAPKTHVVEEEFWNRGIDTPDIPRHILEEYLSNDLVRTEDLYKAQLVGIPDSKRSLLRLQNQDLLVLLEMESNGIRFDFGAMDRERESLQSQLQVLDHKLDQYTDGFSHFNWDSGDHVSCLLYGGTISVDVAEPYEHTYKGGAKAGTTETRNRWSTITKTYPRLCEPVKGSELKKPGYWSVDEGTLRKTRGAKKLVDLILTRSKIEKVIGTYLEGIPKHLEKYDWQDGIIHGQFNQCVAITGRLSSEKPNQQNFPESISNFIISRG